MPLLAAVYRAPSGAVDSSLFLTGRRAECFKSAPAALCQQALKEVATIQSSAPQATDPALLFLSLLRAALLGGQAHVAERRGGVVAFPERWGWLRKAGGLWHRLFTRRQLCLKRVACATV